MTSGGQRQYRYRVTRLSEDECPRVGCEIWTLRLLVTASDGSVVTISIEATDGSN